MRVFLILLLALFLTSCGTSKKPDEQAFLNSLDSAKSGPTIDEEVINSILQQIPSPLEISVLLKESGTKYNVGMLNTPDNLSKYNSNYKKALNLGVFGTDLGYTNIYEQNQDGIRYLSSIKSLADGLNIGQFFDIETIGRLATNSKNLDSLLLITTQNFNSINHYLQTQSRANLSVLLLIGGWVEAMQITCQVAAKDIKNKELREKIGEQKIILEQIVLLLSFYKDDANMASLLNDMNELKVAFDKINITYTYKESTMEIVDGVAVIKDNSTTTINVTNEDIEAIRTLTNSIRNKIIG
ncbi:MAG: hypothetical protein ING84_00090 [Cytophagales bacterium]|jgi:hypothetical protein|nr:hypothetical protein [Cytophagales bacterium]MCA6365425.1 hypothetical protein [Cytophagales bacterium]MCA6370291.1 hypothetical protein [Cytophagales bacterium]MCA6376529.1 hypothetical protein [Cytophagales bacterium]MCA6385432.1 hypothetical protein [Cytophagales bacterium]